MHNVGEEELIMLIVHLVECVFMSSRDRNHEYYMHKILFFFFFQCSKGKAKKHLKKSRMERLIFLMKLFSCVSLQLLAHTSPSASLIKDK